MEGRSGRARFRASALEHGLRGGQLFGERALRGYCRPRVEQLRGLAQRLHGRRVARRRGRPGALRRGALGRGLAGKIGMVGHRARRRRTRVRSGCY
jgi:hypothetical protein